MVPLCPSFPFPFLFVIWKGEGWRMETNPPPHPYPPTGDWGDHQGSTRGRIPALATPGAPRVHAGPKHTPAINQIPGVTPRGAVWHRDVPGHYQPDTQWGSEIPLSCPYTTQKSRSPSTTAAARTDTASGRQRLSSTPGASPATPAPTHPHPNLILHFPPRHH